MKPYGTYARGILELPGYYGSSMDVQEKNDCIPKGFRIRRKKHKRRLHNKSTRQRLKRNLMSEIGAA